MHGARRDFLLGTCGAVVAALFPNCGRAFSSSASVGANSAGATSAVAHGTWKTHAVDPALAARIKAISNVFEVGKAQPDYGYVEKLNDGRGYTVTNYGFCTSTGEVSTVIRRYSIGVPNNPLKRFLALMRPAHEQVSGLEDFPATWREQAHASDRLAAACEEVANKLFFKPAMRAAQRADVRTPVGKLVFYDTWLQHGGDDDPDSFQTIYSRTRRKVDRRHHTEQDFIRTFLTIRKEILLNPNDSSTTAVWQQSAPRVDALLKLLDDNPDLVPPVTVANAEISVVVD
jgi:chitosanase